MGEGSGRRTSSYATGSCISGSLTTNRRKEAGAAGRGGNDPWRPRRRGALGPGSNGAGNSDRVLPCSLVSIGSSAKRRGGDCVDRGNRTRGLRPANVNIAGHGFASPTGTTAGCRGAEIEVVGGFGPRTDLARIAVHFRVRPRERTRSRGRERGSWSVRFRRGSQQ